MKRAVLRPQARQDRRNEVRYYREQAGEKVAQALIDNFERDLKTLQRQPGMGSPVLGKLIELDSLRTWAVTGYPLVLVYFDRLDQLDVVRLLGQRQDTATLLGEKF